MGSPTSQPSAWGHRLSVVPSHSPEDQVPALHTCALSSQAVVCGLVSRPYLICSQVLPPASLDLVGVIHAERLSRLWEDTAASTFHNKYLFKRPGVQAHFSLPRRLLTDDLRNCLPVTDRVIQYHSLLFPRSWRLGESCDFKCPRLLAAEAFTPVPARLPLPPSGLLAASQPGGSFWVCSNRDCAFSQEINVKGLQGQGEAGLPAPRLCERPCSRL